MKRRPDKDGMLRDAPGETCAVGASGSSTAGQSPQSSWADEAYLFHAEHFLKVATAAGELMEQAKTFSKGLALSAAHWPDIKSAWAWAIKHTPENERAREICFTFLEKTYPLVGMGASPEELVPELEGTEKAAGVLGDYQAGLALRALGVIYSRMGRYENAQRLFRRSLAILGTVLDPDHPDILTAHVSLAQAYRDQGHERAGEAFGKVMALVQRHAEDQRSDPFAIQSLALYFQDLGRHREAESLLLQALVLLEESLGYRHPAVATALGNLGISMQELGALLEAEHYFRRAFAIEESIRPDSPEAAYHLEGIAINLDKRGLHSEAEPLLRRVLDIRRNAFQPEHPYIIRTLSNLALNCRDRGFKEEAQELLERAVELYETAATEHPDGVIAVRNRALLLKELGRDGGT